MEPEPERAKTRDIVMDLKFDIPGQMPLECAACDAMLVTGEVAEETANFVASTSFIISMLLSMAKNLLFSLISMMQLYVYLPLLNIGLPGNVRSFMMFFMDLASGDLFTNE